MKMKFFCIALFLFASFIQADDKKVDKLQEELELLKKVVEKLLEKDEKSSVAVDKLKNEVIKLKKSEEKHKKDHRELENLKKELNELKKIKKPLYSNENVENNSFEDEDLFDESDLLEQSKKIDPFEDDEDVEDPFFEKPLQKDSSEDSSLPEEQEEFLPEKSDSLELEIEDDFGEEDETEFYLRNEGEVSQGGYVAEQTRRLTDGVLSVSGFFSLEYNDFQTQNSTVESLFPSDSTFNNSHINLYFDARFYKDFRFFTELRFLYQPFTEIFELGQATRSGEVIIERAWAEWEFRDWLKIRGGTFFIPYGIWNLEHGSPILLSTFTPILLRREIFPEKTTGLQLNGLLTFDNFDLKYYAWVGNGKTQVEDIVLSTQDNQNNKAIGGRVEFQFPYTNIFQELAVGFSAYFGKVQGQEFNGADIQNLIAQVFIAEGNVAVINDLALDGFSAIGEPLDEYEDRAIGFDFRIRLQNFLIQGEFITNFVRPSKAADLGGGLKVKGRSFKEYGGYLQFAYEIDISGFGLAGLVTPFARLGVVQANDQADKELGSFSEYTFGVNWKVNPAVVLKAEYLIIKFADVDERDFGAFFSSFNVSF